MQVYLVQHGDAKPEEEDPDRPLSGSGEEETAKAAARLSALGARPSLVLHSPKLRARQTAEILSRHLQAKIEEAEGLMPKDDPETMMKRIETMQESEEAMLVGHLPQLDRLSSLLLAGDADAGVLLFRNSSPACLEKSEGKWRLKWYFTPELA